MFIIEKKLAKEIENVFISKRAFQAAVADNIMKLENSNYIQILDFEAGINKNIVKVEYRIKCRKTRQMIYKKTEFASSKQILQ